MMCIVRRISLAFYVCVFLLVGEILGTEQAPLLDYGNVFSLEEKEELVEKLLEMEEKHGYDVGVVTYDETLPSPLLTWVKREIGSAYFGEHRLIFALNLTSREVVVEVNGKVEALVPLSKSDHLIAQVTENLSRGNYFTASLFLLVQVEDLFSLQQGQDFSVRGGASGLLWISLSIGLLVAGGVTWGFIYSMNTVRQRDSAEGYFDESKFQITSERERFLYRTVVSVPRQTQQRGGGSGRR